jgi:hypothetical protein
MRCAVNMECSECGSTEFTRLALVYAQGFSELKARSRGWGLGLALEGPVLGFGRARTQGSLQTKLSQVASPPRKKSYWKIIKWGSLISAMVWWGLLYLTALPGGPKTLRNLFPWIEYFNAGLFILALGLTCRYNGFIFPKRYASWDRSFMCRRCGNVAQWTPESEHSLPPIKEVRA